MIVSFVGVFAARQKFYIATAAFMLWVTMPLTAQVIDIEIGDIEALSQQYSPQWQQFENRLDYSTYGEQAETARLNPSLAYDLEFLNDGSQSEYEHYLYLQKEFRTPWHTRNLRDRRDARIQMHDYSLRSERNEWMSNTRLGFVQILIGQREVEVLNELKERISRLAEASAERSETGEESLLDDQLLQMSRYQLQGRIDERSIQLERLITLWRNRMGFDENTEIRFSGDPDAISVQLPEDQDLIQFLERSPGALADRQAVDAAAFEESVARSSRFSSVEFSAGYKQLNPDWRGFLVGVSLPLPILSSNSDAISQAQALKRIEQNELEFSRNERNQITLQLLSELSHYEEKLDDFPEHLQEQDPFISRLIASYEEGTLSVGDFLSTLNLIADTHETRFSQLATYYGIVSELEALTGQEFITQ